MKRAWFFRIKQHHLRTGAFIGLSTGVVFADSKEEAEDKAWALCGGDSASGLVVEEATDEGVCFTSYRSEFPW